jgi:WD40 repeat protein
MYLAVLGLLFVWTLTGAAGSLVGPGTTTRTDLHGDPLPEYAIGRLGTVRLRHGSFSIRCLAYSHDGKILASAGQDYVIRLWDTATGRPLRQLEGWADEMAFSANGKTLAALGRANKLLLIDVASGKKLHSLKLSKRAYSFLFTANGSTVVIGNIGSESSREPGIAAPDPPGALLGGAVGPTGHETTELEYWDVETGKKQKTSSIIPGSFLDAGIAPAPRAPNKIVVFTTHDDVIKSWAAETGKPGVEFRGVGKSFHKAAVSPRGEVLATIGYGTIGLWDTATGKTLQTLECHSVIETPAFSPDSKTFAGQDNKGTIHLWDVTSGKSLRRIDVKGGGWGLAFSPDGKTLAATEGCSIHLWDVKTGKEHLGWPGHRREVASVAFSEDGKTLASGGADGAVFLWRNLDGARPQLLANDLEGVFNVAFAPGRPLLVGSGRNGVGLWDTVTGKLVRQQAEGIRTGRAQFFPDGKTVLIAGDQQLAWLWSIDTGKVRRHNNGDVIFFGGSLTIFETAALSPDGKTMVETSLEGVGTVRDPQTGNPRSTIKVDDRGFGYESMRFAPDSTTLAVPYSRFFKDDKVAFLDVPTSTVLRFTPKLGDWAHALAFSPDGHTLAVGGISSVTLIETASAGLRLHFDGHLGWINEIAFSPNGRLLATASEDGSILLWDLSRLPNEKPGPTTLSEKHLKALWNDLHSKVAAVAYRAIIMLCEDRQNAPTFLLEQLRNLWKHDGQQVRQLIADLNGSSYAVRDKAQAELARLEDIASSALREALESKPTLEQARRVKLLMKKLDPPTPSPRQLLVLRAMEVLQRSATPEVRTWLEELARGAPEARLTIEARLTLERLRKRADRLEAGR